MLRVTLSGPELNGLQPGLPAASLRLLLPAPGATDVVVPTWNGNEFLFEDASRPVIRTLTPLGLNPDSNELDIEIVRHGHGPLSNWADTAQPGDHVAISGMGRGYDIDTVARFFLLAGDESALPAISTLLPALPSEADVQVFVELSDPDASLELPPHNNMALQWCELANAARPGDALVAAVADAVLDPDVRVWAAGEAAAMQRIRRHLFDERHLSRAHSVIRGYWKRERVPRT